MRGLLAGFLALTWALGAGATTLFFAGDSTLDDAGYSRGGRIRSPYYSWGTQLGKAMKADCRVANFAVSGASTKSFAASGYWTKLIAEVRPGDFVVIQFGHNDQKRSTDHYREKIWADPQGLFREIVRGWVQEIRAKGATPVLVSPICRATFDADGRRLVDTTHATPGVCLRTYRDALCELAAELGCDFVDLNTLTRNLLESLGRERAEKFFVISTGLVRGKDGEPAKDVTHPIQTGAAAFARLFLDDVRARGLAVAALFKDRDFPITDFGARADGSPCTAAFAAAMAACERAGGGRVVVPKGRWRSGAIRFRSHCELHLADGAEIVFSQDPADYLPAVPTTWEGMECVNYCPLVYAYGCTNVAITGTGTLRGYEGEWKDTSWYPWVPQTNGVKAARLQLYTWGATDHPVEKREIWKMENAHTRPQLVQFNRCAGVTWQGFKVRNSPFWTLHLYQCVDAAVRDLDVSAHGNNNDGIDIEMSRDVIVEGCRFDQGDDGIVIKSGRNRDAWRLATPTENVFIRDCTVVQGHTVLGIGSEISGGVRNVRLVDCTAQDVNRAVFVKTNRRRGGTLENISVDGLTVGNVRNELVGLSVDTLYEWADFPDYENRATVIRNLDFRNIRGRSARRRADLVGDPKTPVDGVRLENVTADKVKHPDRIENIRNLTDSASVASVRPTPPPPRSPAEGEVTSVHELVEWEFPRLGNCHEGLPFSDGVTGVLVWGGGDELRLTVGRADLWDHRGGYPWTAEQNYADIVRLWRAGEKDKLLSLFKKETPPGEPRNPYLLPLGRVVVRIPGKTLKRGTLDPFTGLGEIEFADGGKIGIAMARASRSFAMRFPEGVACEVKSVPATDSPVYENKLKPLGFEKATVFDGRVPNVGGFRWRLPADEPAWLSWSLSDRDLVLKTGRGEEKVGAECHHSSDLLRKLGCASVDTTPRASFEKVAAASVAQWKDFWSRSARVKVPDPVIQRLYDYGLYRFGAMTDPDGVPAGLQGPWLEDDKLVPWNGDYHFNINVQECYSPAFRGGHFRHLMPLFRMILSWRSRLRDNARKYCGIDDGYTMPHSVDDRGVCIGGFWTGTIDHASTAWMASYMFRYVKYARDVEFLRESAYDFMKGAMNVYLSMLEDKDGILSIPLGPSPEWKGSDFHRAVGRNPSFQLAACHRLARDLVAAAEMLGERPDPRWLDVGRRLPAYSTVATKTSGSAAWGGLDGNGIAIFEGTDLSESHRHHSHMAGLYPFDTIPRGEGVNDKLVDDTYANWVLKGTGLWTGWCVPWASVLQVDAGNATAAVSLLRAWDAFYCDEGHGSHHNAVRDGFTNFRNGRGVMQMDGQCAAATAVLELMAHEINGKTQFFRGCPENWKDVSFENLALSDGRRVNGRRVNGVVTVDVNEER